MVSVSTTEKFLFSYSVLLFFITFMISLGFSGFGGNIAGLTPPIIPQTGIDIFNFLPFVFDNIVFFFTLMTVDTGIAFLGILLFSPAIILLIYILLKLIRGGG